MWLLKLNNGKRSLFKDIDKALDAMTDAIVKGKDEVLLDDTNDYMSWTLEFCPIEDTLSRWQKTNIFKGDQVQMYHKQDQCLGRKRTGRSYRLLIVSELNTGTTRW